MTGPESSVKTVNCPKKKLNPIPKKTNTFSYFPDNIIRLSLCYSVILVAIKSLVMKVILDIQENRVPFFMELLKSLDYIHILKEIKSKEKSQAIQDLAEAFQ